MRKTKRVTIGLLLLVVMLFTSCGESNKIAGIPRKETNIIITGSESYTNPLYITFVNEKTGDTFTSTFSPYNLYTVTVSAPLGRYAISEFEWTGEEELFVNKKYIDIKDNTDMIQLALSDTIAIDMPSTVRVWLFVGAGVFLLILILALVAIRITKKQTDNVWNDQAESEQKE